MSVNICLILIFSFFSLACNGDDISIRTLSDDNILNDSLFNDNDDNSSSSSSSNNCSKDNFIGVTNNDKADDNDEIDNDKNRNVRNVIDRSGDESSVICNVGHNGNSSISIDDDNNNNSSSSNNNNNNNNSLVEKRKSIIEEQSSDYDASQEQFDFDASQVQSSPQTSQVGVIVSSIKDEVSPSLYRESYFSAPALRKRRVVGTTTLDAAAKILKSENCCLSFERLTANAYPPYRGSIGAVGYDLKSAYDYRIPAHSRVLVKTDLSIRFPPGTYGRLAPRSGLALKHSIDVGAGVIDPDYTGNVCALLINHSDTVFQVKRGDRVVQLICERAVFPTLRDVTVNDDNGNIVVDITNDDNDDNEKRANVGDGGYDCDTNKFVDVRGSKGFGSSGIR